MYFRQFCAAGLILSLDPTFSLLDPHTCFDSLRWTPSRMRQVTLTWRLVPHGLPSTASQHDQSRVDINVMPVVGAGFAEAMIVANSPPHGGYVDASPRAGLAAVDTFVLESLEWSDDAGDFPLTFSFSVAYGQVRVRDLWKFSCYSHYSQIR